MIVECTSVDDMIAVLHEGMKNRKQGSHELNKDSNLSLLNQRLQVAFDFDNLPYKRVLGPR